MMSFTALGTLQDLKIYSVVIQRETSSDTMNFNPKLKAFEDADHEVIATAGFLSSLP